MNRRHKLTEHADERSSYAITLYGWVDAAGLPVEPDVITWTLTTVDGTVINEREDVPLDPTPPVVILLNDLDLAFLPTEDAKNETARVVTVTALYDSHLAVGITLRRQYAFVLDPLVAVE